MHLTGLQFAITAGLVLALILGYVLASA